MKINKSLDIDLNIISPQKHIRIHEGDIDSVDILIGVFVDDESVDLDGVVIKYDATINNYLAEQDAKGSVVDGKISIPVTQNMTAMSGLLLIDVRMIQSDQILFTQTICATVEKAVVNGSTYIDFDKITIIQRMNALEKQIEHVEEIVENFDTSKLITSTNRPPSGAPSEVDVDLLRVGDTWIQRGDKEIVYKLVSADYHFKPYPTADPYHKFTWQPLNERHNIGNTEPPTTVTYQAVDYSVDGVAWSWFPVQDYFQGDHYAQQITADESTYYICEDASLDSYNTGICDYFWREEGGSGDLSTKMDLATLKPTAEQIAAMPSGQFYGDSVNQKGIVKDGQSFYDSEYIDNNISKIYTSTYNPPWLTSDSFVLKIGDIWIHKNSRTLEIEKICILSNIGTRGTFKELIWQTLFTTDYYDYGEFPPTEGTVTFQFYGKAGISTAAPLPRFFVNDEYRYTYNGVNSSVYKCKSINVQLSTTPITYSLFWGSPVPTTARLSDNFSISSLAPIDIEHTIFPTVARMKELLATSIGDIETALSEV